MLVETEKNPLTCHMPSPVCVIFSTDKAFLSFCGSGIAGGECNITNSLNITEDPRLRVDVGGLSKLELAEFYDERVNGMINKVGKLNLP